jgi:hypothetical protein
MGDHDDEDDDGKEWIMNALFGCQDILWDVHCLIFNSFSSTLLSSAQFLQLSLRI